MTASARAAASPGCVVAVDVGTSAVRALVTTAEGVALASTRVGRVASAGSDTFDAEALVADVVAALAGLGPVTGVRALAVSAHIGTVALDVDGAVLERAGGWSDPRGLAELERVDATTRADVLRRSGRPAGGSSALAYALSLAARPATAARVASLLSPTGLLVQRLTGVRATDTVDAAYTLLSDVVQGGWDVDGLVALGLDPSWFPRQAAPTEVVGELQPQLALRCGLPAGLPVVAGGPDGSVGAGLLLGADRSLVADVAGTTDVLARRVDRPEDAPAGTVLNPALDGSGWTAGGPTGMTGGTVARWRSMLVPVAEAELAAVPPGADGLLVLPSTTGSRFPRWVPSDRGAVLGQRPDHGPAELLRAAQEGAAFAVREAVDLLDAASGAARATVVLSGGTARSRSAAQLRADVLGRRTLVSDEPDVTLLGAAALALVGAGLVDDLEDARLRLGTTFTALDPDPRRTARYGELFGRWCEARDQAGALPVDPR